MHEREYRARGDGLQPGLTVEDLRRQVRELKADKGFDITLEQRLAYLTSEVGEVAREVLRLSRDGSADAGKMAAEDVASVRENLGMEIYDVLWNLLDLADLAGIDLEGAFEKKAQRNEGREW
ncbi:MAG: MazG-like family protein [Actinomycetota bacterium]|nr:MazG-like family protein [Actinomycetota bacterium]